MNERQRWTIPATRVRSLVWNGDALLDPASGWRRYELDELATGRRLTSRDTPPLALDPPRRRFAVAGPEHITVVQLG